MVQRDVIFDVTLGFDIEIIQFFFKSLKFHRIVVLDVDPSTPKKNSNSLALHTMAVGLKGPWIKSS
jgi:hypothetical protein